LKILIVPYYFYTHFNAIKQFILSTTDRKIEIIVLCINGNSSIKRINEAQFDSLKYLDVTLHQLNLFEIMEDKKRIMHRAIRFISILLNFNIIKKYITNQRPDVIILGTDVGGVYIRKLQDIADYWNIPVFVLQTVLFLPVKKRLDLFVPYPKIVLFMLKLFRLERVFTFCGDIPGSYSDKTIVLASSGQVRNLLIAQGIDQGRIIVTGNPYHDVFYKAKRKRLKKYSSTSDSIKSCKQKSIVYCTEVIQETLGSHYLHNLNSYLFNVFSSLPEEINIVIKFHPREEDEIRDLYKEIFHNKKYQFVSEMDALELFNKSSLCILHHSVIALEAMLSGVSVISIDFSHNGKQELLSLPDALVCKSHEEFEKIVSGFFYDNLVKERIDEGMHIWKEYLQIPEDGENSVRVLSAISQRIK